jgi:threonine/homoserine efflux transporter RhtA
MECGMESTYFINQFLASIEERKEVNSMYKILAVLGLALLGAPFVLNYGTNPGALWTSVGSGAFITLLAGIEWLKKGTWEYALTMILGMFVVLAPFAFDFAEHTIAVWTTVILGVAVAFLSGAKYLETNTPYEW